MDRMQHHTRGIAAILAASLLWGTTGTAASFAPDVSALAIGAFAMGVAGLLLVLRSLGELARDRARLLVQSRILLLGGLAVAIYPLAFYSAMRLSGVAVGTVVSIASAPLFTVILEWACTRRSVSLRWGLSFAFGAAGIALLATGRPEPGSADTGIAWTWLGVLVGLLAGLTYATYSWAARHMIEQGVGSASSMASMFGVAAIVLPPSLLLTGQNLFATPINARVALYMALIPMFVGYLCFGYGLRYIAASTATLITLLEPVVAVLLAVLVVGEWLAPAGWVGMTLIMLSLLMQTLRSSPDASGSPAQPHQRKREGIRHRKILCSAGGTSVSGLHGTEFPLDLLVIASAGHKRHYDSDHSAGNETGNDLIHLSLELRHVAPVAHHYSARDHPGQRTHGGQTPPEQRHEDDRPESCTESCPGEGHQSQDVRARIYRQQCGDDSHHQYPQTTQQDLGLCREVAAEDLVQVFDQRRGTHQQLR